MLPTSSRTEPSENDAQGRESQKVAGFYKHTGSDGTDESVLRGSTAVLPRSGECTTKLTPVGYDFLPSEESSKPSPYPRSLATLIPEGVL